MRTLGRVGQPLSGGTYRPRRRFRAPRWLLATVVLALLALTWVAFTANRQVGDSPSSVAASDAPARLAGDERVSRSARDVPAGRIFATVEGMTLAVPHSAPVAVAFQEASHPEALTFEPVGQLLANDNPSGFQPPPDTVGAQYRVLSSRGRGRPATSAAAIAVPLGDAVSSPVTGTVKAVTEYPLYGRIRDWRIEITPEGRPDLTVVLIHLLKPPVQVGQTVTAGETPLAVARLLPFDSHVDAVTAERGPHVLIEVKPSVAAKPVDPNQPALPVDSEDPESF